jgi:hypothetical protein
MPQRDRVPTSNQREEGNGAMLQWLCRSALQHCFPAFQNMNIDARFYPYVGMTHTIRRKGSAWMIRISDHCRNAPKPVLEAIIMILACKVMRRKPGWRFLETYELFRKDPQILEAVKARRLLKGRKQLSADAGNYHSLRDIYGEINSRYFQNQIEIEKIGWGLRQSWNHLGHYDPVHHTITLSPVLDSTAVPKSVVSYIVYHEMLHAIFEGQASRSSRKHHPPEFRQAEKAFPDYASAKKFLKEYCGKRTSSH